MLEVQDVHTYYGDSYVLQGVSLRVEEGQVAVLLGRNGAGKTTLFRSIMGLTPPRRGRIMFRGQNITAWPAYRVVARGIGLVPQGRRIFGSLTVAENLEVAERPAAAHSNVTAWTRSRIMEWFPRLRERERHGGTKLSGGEQQMLACARGLVGNPALLVMDEPTEGLAPLIVNQVEELIHQLKAQGMSILLAEQRFGFGLGVADYVYVLSHGRIAYEGPPDGLKDNEPVKRAYLGV
jgi:branched-chain amino acid transport system ATP-binding protein